MKSLAYLVLNAACLLPVLLSLDSATPLAFLALAALFLAARKPRRLLLFLAALGGAAVLAFWVWLSNRLWTPGPEASARALLLALRAFALTGISASFALGVEAASLLDEAMQLWRLPARSGYALFVAFNAVPRLAEEGRLLDAAHRVRLGGRRRPILSRATTLLARAIRQGERSALSLAARGLDGTGPRTWYRPAAWTLRDSLGLAAGLALAGTLLAALVATGSFRFGFY